MKNTKLTMKKCYCNKKIKLSLKAKGVKGSDASNMIKELLSITTNRNQIYFLNTIANPLILSGTTSSNKNSNLGG